MDTPRGGLGAPDVVAVVAVTGTVKGQESHGPGSAGLHWTRVAHRRMRLSDEAEIIRQEHRGVLWYVVRDRLGDRYYRFDPNAYLFLSLLDGQRTVEEAYAIVTDRLGGEAPTQIEVIRLLWRLHVADLLRGDTAGRTEESVARAEQADRKRWLMQLRSPLAIRLPLFDPGDLFDRLGWLARLLFSWPAFLLWLVLLVSTLVQVGIHWSELTHNFSDRVLAFDNIVLIWAVFPMVKLLHEVGHGLALRRWGCRSHELGIMFLVFMPVPYIDASSSAVLGRPSQRAAVAGAGLYVELFIASCATWMWMSLEPGLARAVCFNVMLVAGASAVLFNGNPLLKFDAYYALSDVLEIPNLGPRSAKWHQAWLKRWVLGIRDVEYPVEAKGEGKWLALYTPLSLIYRMFLVFTIAVFVAKKFFFLGTAFALIALYNVLLQPLIGAVKFLLRSPRLRKGRLRGILGAGALVGGILAVLFLVPLPYRSIAQGVVWYSEGAELRMGASGTVGDFAISSGNRVKQGDLIATLSDPENDAEIANLEARLAALDAQYRAELMTDRDKARLTAEEIQYNRQRRAVAIERRAALAVRSPADGLLVMPDQRSLRNGWVGRGTPVGHIVGDASPVVLAVLQQADMELVSAGLAGVSVRFAAGLSEDHKGRVARVTPQATDELPAELLASPAGGPFSLRQNRPGESGPHALEKIFVLEIAVAGRPEPSLFGSRAYVRFDYGRATLATQIARKLRQLFLREFEV